MENCLIELVRKHEGKLRIKPGEKPDEYEDFARFRDFSMELIKMPNFTYNYKKMIEMGGFLIDQQFRLEERYAILNRIVRRKTMDPIKDTEKRKGLWLTLDSYMGPETGKMGPLMVYVARHGVEEAKKDLQKMQLQHREKINPEMDKMIDKIIKTPEGKEKHITEEIYENHVQTPNFVHSIVIPRMILELENLRETHKSEAVQ